MLAHQLARSVTARQHPRDSRLSHVTLASRVAGSATDPNVCATGRPNDHELRQRVPFDYDSIWLAYLFPVLPKSEFGESKL
jgi:hypothetical protein